MAVAVTGAFNVSPAYTGRFIPTLWAGKLNVKFYTATVFGEIANTSYEGDIKGMGDKVVINNIPTITIRTYVVGQTLQSEVPVPNIVELVIDKAKYFNFSISDVLEYQSQPKLMDMFTSDAAQQMAIVIDRDVLLGTFDQGAAANKGSAAGAISGAYDLGTDANPLVLTAANVLQVFTSLASVLDEQNVPSTERWLVITPYVRQLLMSSPLAQAYVTGDASSILRNGKIGTIDRFTLYVSNNLPMAATDQDFIGGADAGTQARTAIMAGHKSAITFASQIAKVESLQNPSDFGTLVRGLNVYGYEVIKPEALALALYSTDGSATA